MNPKDSGFIQKYVEKLVLGIAVLCLLGTAYIFVVQDPFPVKVGNKKVGPDQITKTITDAANRLETKINSDETALPDRGIPSYSEAFVADLQEKPTTLAQLTPLAEPGLEELDGPIVKEYNLPHPPIAQDILVRKGHAVLGDNIPTREMEGLIRLVGNHQPRDFAYVSVAGTFDMDEWIERLQSGDKETRVPDRWWNSMIGIAGVMLQRQELNEETGEWGNTTIIDPLPGQLASQPGVKFTATTQQAKQMIQLIRSSQETIARPDFPQTAGNVLWSPPNEDQQELDAEGQRKLARVNSRILKLQEQIENLQEQIIRAREAEAERAERERATGGRDRTTAGVRRPAARPGAAMGGGEFGGGGYDDGGGGARTGRATRRPAGRDAGRQPDAETPEQRMQLLQEDLVTAKIERSELLGIEPDVLNQQRYSGAARGMGGYGGEMGGYGMGGEMGGYGMGGEMGGYGGEMGGYGMGGGYGMDPYGGGYGGGGMGGYGAGMDGANPQNTEPESRKLKVWAHDLSIEPGKTYRYRIVVTVLNPLYRQKRVAEEQREANYDLIALGPDENELTASPWSKPVTVDQQHYFFMVKGSTQTARVEVWHVYNGQWYNKEFEVRPGDPIGQKVMMTVAGNQEVELDMNVGRIVVDLVQSAGTGTFGAADVRMLYLNPQENKIADRSIEEDRDNPDLIRLRNEKALQAELALTSTGTTGAPRDF